MPRDLGSIRIARLNKLMYTLLSYYEISRDELLAQRSYTSVRMLQRDIAYLRNEYSVNVFYDFSRRSYRCTDSGHFVLYFELSEEESAVFVTGLRLTELALPELSCGTRSLWEKLRAFTNGTEAGICSEGSFPEPVLLLPPESARRYRRIAALLESFTKR